jgi:hypothetical protein
VTTSQDQVARIVSLAPIIRMDVATLRAWVCKNKLQDDGAATFSDLEMSDALMREHPDLKRPCGLTGPWSAGYYLQSISDLWH